MHLAGATQKESSINLVFWFLVSLKWFYVKCLFILGIVLDLIMVGVIKMAVRRQRPPYNHDDQVFEAPVADKFSFPSGHTSRATMLAVFL